MTNRESLLRECLAHPGLRGSDLRDRLYAALQDRSIPAVIERLRFGDSDGDDHDIAAAELERLLNDIQELTCGDPRKVCPNCRDKQP